MKKVIAVALFFVVAMTVMASGGVLNRPGNAISVGDLGSAGCFSVFGPALDQQQGVLEIGIVGLATDFAYNRDGALGGGHFDAKKEVFPFPYGNIAYRWNKATLALSSNVPYGLATDYSENLGFRSEMIFANATTSIGYELNEQLFLGAGLRTVYSKVAFEMPLYAERVYLGQTSTNLDGYGCGLSLEAKLNMNDGLEMALVYEPAIKVRVAG
ncbi:outer membrane protein transport protein, partial [Patescibacteria group bacterium]|nr:outer membrane protein transport protein [Patescibacteria group bacterium]